MSRKKINISELDLKKVGGRIALIRDKSGLNQEQFAENIELSKSNISQIENHIFEPSFKSLVKIIEHYCVNPDWLLTGEGEMTRQGPECDTCIYKVGDPLDRDPKIAELVEMVKKVLKSGTNRAETLTVNIRSSYQGIIKDREMENRVVSALEEINDRLAALEEVAHPPTVSQEIRESDDQAQRGEILKKRKA